MEHDRPPQWSKKEADSCCCFNQSDVLHSFRLVRSRHDHCHRCDCVVTGAKTAKHLGNERESDEPVFALNVRGTIETELLDKHEEHPKGHCQLTADQVEFPACKNTAQDVRKRI